jgi:hypothetical protein
VKILIRRVILNKLYFCSITISQCLCNSPDPFFFFGLETWKNGKGFLEDYLVVYIEKEIYEKINTNMKIDNFYSLKKSLIFILLLFVHLNFKIG